MNRFSKIFFTVLLATTLVVSNVYVTSAQSAPLQANPNNEIQFNNGFGDCKADISCYILRGIGTLLVKINLIAMQAAAAIAEFAMRSIFFIFELTKELFTFDIVKKGFAATLGIANLGFILVLIIIAFATILRIKQYGVKSLLRNFVLAVLLINFSFAIAGIFVDFSHITSGYFLSGGGREVIGESGDKIMAALGVQQLLKPDDQTVKIEDGKVSVVDSYNFWGWEGIAKLLLITIFILTFLIFTSLVLATIAITLLVRLIALSLLVIVMPLAWLFLVTPRLTNLWSKWWSEFLKWIFYLPAITFFIFLVAQSGEELSNKVKSVTAGTASAVTKLDSAIGIPDFTNIALRMIILLGFLVGGLIVSKKIGVAGSSFSMDAAKGIATGFTGKKFEKIKVENIGKGIGTMARKGVSRVPLLRDVVGAVSPALRKDTKLRMAEKAQREAGKPLPEVDQNATAAMKAVQSAKLGAAKAKRALAEKMFGIKSVDDMEKKVNSGELTVDEVRKVAGWKSLAAGGAGAGGAALAGLAVAGPVGAAVGAGIGAILATKKWFATRKARAALTLARLGGAEKTEGAGGSIETRGEITLLGSDKRGISKFFDPKWHEQRRINNAGAKLKAAQKTILEAEKAKKEKDNISHIKHALGIHDDASHGKEDHGKGGGGIFDKGGGGKEESHDGGSGGHGGGGH